MIKIPVQSERIWPWPQFLYFLGAVMACLLLTLSIQYGSGYYNYISISLFVASVTLSVLVIPLLFLTKSGKISPSFTTSTLILFVAVLLILELYLGTQDVYLHYNQNPLFPKFAPGITWLIILLTATYLIGLARFTPQSSWGQTLSNLNQYRFPLILLLALILKITAIFASPTHHIDVGIIMQESSTHLLNGQNPYGTKTAWLDGFDYLPLNLLLPLPFYAILGDTRFGSVFWEMVGILFVYRLAKTELRALPKLVNLAELVILLFFLQPRGLFVIEQSWGEPLMVGAMAVAFYFFYYQPAGPLADVLFGLMLVIKQYLVFMTLPLLILYHRAWKRYLITGLACLAVLLPFILWNPLAFYKMTVLHFMQLPIQTDSLSLTAYFAEYGLLVPRWVSPVAATIVAVGLGLLLSRFGLVGYFQAASLTLLTLFLLGQQAFANYYYLISFMQVLALVFFLVIQFAPSGRSTPGFSETTIEQQRSHAEPIRS